MKKMLNILQKLIIRAVIVFSLLFFFIYTVIPTAAQSVKQKNSEEWQIHNPEGETYCADGSKFHYFTRKGNPDKLLVYFTGGGACWSPSQCDTCANPGLYAYNISKRNDPRYFNGIFDFDNPKNPFKNYTIIVAPTCTGDVGIGDSIVNYKHTNENGNKQSIKVYHKGYENAIATIRWAYRNMIDPEIIVVAGSSAGALATPLYTNVIANHYPNTRLVGIGDGGGSYSTAALIDANFDSWNLDDLTDNHMAFKNLNTKNLGIEKLFVSAVEQNHSNIELYQVDQAHDRTQKYFLTLAGNKDPSVLRSLKQSRNKIIDHYPKFRSFTIGGVEHTVLASNRFYYYKSNNVLFRKWVGDILNDEEVPSIHCINCTQPDFKYSNADLRIIQRMNELLSKKEKWNPDDNYQKDPDCKQSKVKLSLRCALIKAIQEEGGAFGDFPVSYSILYSIRKEFKDKSLKRNSKIPALVQYNNHNVSKFEDIKILIQDVELKIRSKLNK